MYCIECTGSESDGLMTTIAVLADDMIQPAVKWLLDQRRQQREPPAAAAGRTSLNDDGWGVDTPRILRLLLALHRIDAAPPAARSAVGSWDALGIEGQLWRQQFDIQLLLFLLKYSL